MCLIVCVGVRIYLAIGILFGSNKLLLRGVSSVLLCRRLDVRITLHPLSNKFNKRRFSMENGHVTNGGLANGSASNGHLNGFSSDGKSLRIAIIGQSQFGADVYKLLRDQKHQIVAVFTIPDVKGRADQLAQAAEADGVPVHKLARWRVKGAIIPEVAELYKSVNAELNVLPFCSQFIPMEVIEYPKHQSIIYHPSLLPLHRGASAINWTLINGDKKAGFTIFWADDGLDTGPILLQKSCSVEPDDTVDTLYNRFLYPEGVKSMGEAVQMIANGSAPRVVQPTEGASYDPMMKKDLAKINWEFSANELHNFIRGTDRSPGAWAVINGEKLSVFGSKVWSSSLDSLKNPVEVPVEGGSRSAIVHDDGMLLFAADGKSAVNVTSVWPEDGKMMRASKYARSSADDDVALDLNEAEQELANGVRQIWARIFGVPEGTELPGQSDFFKMGAGSMEVVRLLEEIRSVCGDNIQLRPEEVYMSPTLDEVIKVVVLISRGELGSAKPFTYDAVTKEIAGGRTLRFPRQLFINNEFCDSSDGSTFDTINPADETVICAVSKGTKADVDRAVEAASRAFNGEWGQMNARDRGKLIHRLADLIDEHKEELAALESIDSGAVYTLALKTHIGMSADSFRYFAGWADKIQGTTIPINHARPSRNLTFTKSEPIGVCAIITPWNYPLMMLAWKMSACLAAGNTVVLKPAMVTPLTSLKFGELVVMAGFPPGVINIVPGSGTVVGQALADHPLVRKLGFTGSTPVGKTIMESCGRSNLKKVSLELGGKSPLIIFSDCDLDKAVRYGCSSVFFNKGENCIAAGRLFVEDSIHDKFVARVVEEARRMKIGDPLDTATDHGPQNHMAHLKSLLDYCKKGVEEGAKLVLGGKRVDRPGLFLEPTIFTDVEDWMFIAKEESFGPIMIISRFSESDLDAVIARANATEYGLASGVFTKDISRALRVAEKIQAGTVFVNTYNKTDVAAPFGGMKQSGFGKDLGQEALKEYLQTKTVTVEY